MTPEEKANKAQALQDKLVSQINQSKKEELTAVSDFIYDELVTKKQINRIPEPVFVQQFLGVFSGTQKLGNQTDTLVNWVAVAGDPYSEVAVVDTAGHELYRVPALMDSSVIDPKKPLQQSISDFITQYKLKTDYLPSVGMAHAVKGTVKILTEIGHTNKVEENTKRWDDIMKRYDNKLNTDTQTTNKTENTKSGNNGISGFELSYE